jgi:hypothetical protein
MNLTELTIALVVLGAVLVPLGGAFTRGKVESTLSRMNYTAMSAARSCMEELRAVEWSKLGARRHEWRRLELLGLKLPDDYARIETKLELGEVVRHGAAEVRRAVLHVRWQENGRDGRRSAEQVLATVLACHQPVQGVH